MDVVVDVVVGVAAAAAPHIRDYFAIAYTLVQLLLRTAKLAVHALKLYPFACFNIRCVYSNLTITFIIIVTVVALMNAIDTLIKYICARTFLKYTCGLDEELEQVISAIFAICPQITIPNIRVDAELVIDCVKFVASEMSLTEPFPL